MYKNRFLFAIIAQKSEHFRYLIRQDQTHHVQERLESLLLEGLNSGIATSFTEKDWEDIRQAVRAKISPLGVQ